MKKNAKPVRPEGFLKNSQNLKKIVSKGFDERSLVTVITGGVNGIGRAIVEKTLARGDTVFVLDCVDENSDVVKELKGAIRLDPSRRFFANAQNPSGRTADCDSFDLQKNGKNNPVRPEGFFKNSQNLKKIVSKGSTNGPLKQNLTYIQTDISSVDSIKNAFKIIFSKTNSIDLLVNNAGIARDNIALRIKESDWNSVLDVNLKGAFFCAQQALTKMIRQKKSYIINMSSVVGLTGNPGQVNYAASKAGVIAMTKTLAREYASRNVLVNAIAPGFIVTRLTDKLPDAIKEQAKNLIPLKRFGIPDDIAELVLFLSSGNADYITGQVIKVDGGMVL